MAVRRGGWGRNQRLQHWLLCCDFCYLWATLNCKHLESRAYAAILSSACPVPGTGPELSWVDGRGMAGESGSLAKGKLNC